MNFHRNGLIFYQICLEHAKSLTIDPQYYKVICRNGTLADHTGFDVDDDCALATYVDSKHLS